MKGSDTKFPKSALALYVKLYCKKRAVTKNKKDNILMEATKSWVSLSKSDKQHFNKLFQEYQTKLNKKYASHLQSAQPYMRRKDENSVRKLSKSNEDVDLDQRLSAKDQEICDQNTYSACIINNENTEIQNQCEQLGNCNSITSVQSMHCSDVPELNISYRMISEPTPPVRTSIELFDIIKNNNEDMQNVNWTELSKTEKQRYQRALSTIKTAYIIQYGKYLEQLTPKQLFYHYKSKF